MTGHWLDKVVTLLKAETADLRELALMCRKDPTNFYLGATLDGADLRGQDLRGLQFTDLDSARVLTDEGTRLGEWTAELVEPEPPVPDEDSASKGSVFSALDIGARGVTCTIFEHAPQANAIADFRVAASEFVALEYSGIRLDAERLARVVGHAVERAERSARQPISGAVVATSLGQIDSQRYRGRITLGWAPISDADLSRAIGVALAEARLPGRRPIHILPLHWIVDDGPRALDPRGVKGVSLEVDILLVSIEESAFRLVADALELAHLDLIELFAAPLAEALAAVSAREISGHTLCLDMGTDHVGATVFASGAVVHVGSLPIGTDSLATSVSRQIGVSFETIREALHLLVRRADSGLGDTLLVGLDGVTTTFLMSELLTAVSVAVGEQLAEVMAYLNRRGLPVTGAAIVVTGALAALAEMGPIRRSPLGGPLRVHRPSVARRNENRTVETMSAQGILRRSLHGPQEAVSTRKLLARVPILGHRPIPRPEGRAGVGRRRPR